MEEKERKGQYSTFHTETNVFEWLCIPYKQLVLISEGILLSIPLEGIKHYAWRRCKSGFQFILESNKNGTENL